MMCSLRVSLGNSCRAYLSTCFELYLLVSQEHLMVSKYLPAHVCLCLALLCLNDAKDSSVYFCLVYQHQFSSSLIHASTQGSQGL